MLHWLLISLILGLIFDRGSSIEMLQNVSLTQISVQNGSQSGVVLDCPYQLGEGDGDGLVVKWYYQGVSRPPVYQWIQGNKPQFSGALTERIDLSYETSDDELHKYRALFIPNPTTELTGKYICWVSDYNSDNYVEIMLTVYSPVNELILELYESTDSDSVTIFCTADGVYPQPNLTLYRNDLQTNTLLEENEVSLEVVYDEDNGTYTTTLEKMFQFQDLSEENNFVCSLAIPDTEYLVEEELNYVQKKVPRNDNGGGSGSSSIASETFFLNICRSLVTLMLSAAVTLWNVPVRWQR